MVNRQRRAIKACLTCMMLGVCKEAAEQSLYHYVCPRYYPVHRHILSARTAILGWAGSELGTWALLKTPIPAMKGVTMGTSTVSKGPYTREMLEKADPKTKALAYQDSDLLTILFTEFKQTNLDEYSQRSREELIEMILGFQGEEVEPQEASGIIIERDEPAQEAPTPIPSPGVEKPKRGRKPRTAPKPDEAEAISAPVDVSGPAPVDTLPTPTIEEKVNTPPLPDPVEVRGTILSPRQRQKTPARTPLPIKDAPEPQGVGLIPRLNAIGEVLDSEVIPKLQELGSLKEDVAEIKELLRRLTDVLIG